MELERWDNMQSLGGMAPRKRVKFRFMSRGYDTDAEQVKTRHRASTSTS